MIDKSRCLICLRRLMPMTDANGRTDLRCKGSAAKHHIRLDGVVAFRKTGRRPSPTACRHQHHPSVCLGVLPLFQIGLCVTGFLFFLD
jgi:hypothetical protein